MPAESFLTDFATDLLALIGMVGFILTAVGVWFAWLQLKESTSATEAAINALEKSRIEYNRFIVSQCDRLLAEARLNAAKDNWNLAAIRLFDVADFLNRLGTYDTSWQQYSEKVTQMGNSFEKIERQKTSISKSLWGKWKKLDNELSRELANHSKPFGNEIR